MIVKEQNEGEKIPYELVQGYKILFDDMVSYNIPRYQQEQENTLNICLDDDMQLTNGLGKWYVANIIIPARKYELVVTGEKDEEGNDKYARVATPLNMDEVTLVLWTLPVNYYFFNGGAY